MSTIDKILLVPLFFIGFYFIFAGICACHMWYWYYIPKWDADMDVEYCKYKYLHWKKETTKFYFFHE